MLKVNDRDSERVRGIRRKFQKKSPLVGDRSHVILLHPFTSCRVHIIGGRT